MISTSHSHCIPSSPASNLSPNNKKSTRLIYNSLFANATKRTHRQRRANTDDDVCDDNECEHNNATIASERICLDIFIIVIIITIIIIIRFLSFLLRIRRRTNVTFVFKLKGIYFIQFN